MCLKNVRQLNSRWTHLIPMIAPWHPSDLYPVTISHVFLVHRSSCWLQHLSRTARLEGAGVDFVIWSSESMVSEAKGWTLGKKWVCCCPLAVRKYSRTMPLALLIKVCTFAQSHRLQSMPGRVQKRYNGLEMTAFARSKYINQLELHSVTKTSDGPPNRTHL